ncbi:hypothetical protein ABW20_dc0100233 [Dactylellina cionopaga]|nr:hypothetical protein ABW20_dc0100233 [Dactylellina cionopaga]
MSGKVSKYPYPGHKNASTQILHIWVNSDASPSNVEELFGLIMGGLACPLKTALSGVAYGGEPGYDDAEIVS